MILMNNDMLARAVDLLREFMESEVYGDLEWESRVGSFLLEYNSMPRPEASEESHRQFEEYRKTQNMMVIGDGYQTR